MEHRENDLTMSTKKHERLVDTGRRDGEGGTASNVPNPCRVHLVIGPWIGRKFVDATRAGTDSYTMDHFEKLHDTGTREVEYVLL